MKLAQAPVALVAVYLARSVEWKVSVGDFGGAKSPAGAFAATGISSVSVDDHQGLHIMLPASGLKHLGMKLAQAPVALVAVYLARSVEWKGSWVCCSGYHSPGGSSVDSSANNTPNYPSTPLNEPDRQQQDQRGTLRRRSLRLKHLGMKLAQAPVALVAVYLARSEV
jgi:hypothetical protein